MTLHGPQKLQIVQSVYDAIISAICAGSADLPVLLDILKKISQIENSHRPPVPPVKFLCAQGGGAKGAAYTGTVKAMDETGTLAQLKMVGGASAGAINAFMIGLGLNAQEIDILVRYLNFLDLNDYSKAVTTKLHNALGHSGENFYHWACMMMEHIAGDPNTTFREYHELCMKNPNLKDMAFKGTMLQPKQREVTFSFIDTPDVRIVDAVRASMSFPGAFEPWKVYQKTASGLEWFGTFTDGGVLNNYPITIFNDQNHEDPHYPRVDTSIRSQADKVARNPCSVGLALCNKLKKLNKDITPFTPRIESLLLDKSVIGAQKDQTIEEELKAQGWHFHDLAHVLVKHAVGLNPEDPEAKYLAFSDQTVQIYTENVDTLEFSLTPEKQKLIETSGYHAWMQWFKSKQNPAKFYEQKTNFEQDFFPKDGNGQLLVSPNASQIEAHFKRLFTDYFLVLLTEAMASKNNPLDEFKDPLNNQRLKFYAHLIMKAIDVYQTKNCPRHVNEVLNAAFDCAVHEHAHCQAQRATHREHVKMIVDEDLALSELIGLISSQQPSDHEKALRLFKGKLSTIFTYLQKTNGMILCLAALSGDCILLNGMLNQLAITRRMLGQTGRPLGVKLPQLLDECSELSLYKFAIESDNAAQVIPLLLKFKVSPLRRDKHGKNAFDYALASNNIDALTALQSTIKTFSAKECLSLFESDHFLHKCAQNPKFASFAQSLIETLTELTIEQTQFDDRRYYNQFMALLEEKHNDKTALYYAAQADNPVMIKALRAAHNVSVNHSGPADNPSALTAAGERGACKAVIELVNCNAPVAKANPDQEGRTVMHYLAMSENPNVAQAMYAVLPESTFKISNAPDNQGNSPFFYLIHNKNAAAILTDLCEMGKKKHWTLDTFFDLTKKRENGFTDLEWAFKLNPDLGNKIASLIPKKRGQEIELVKKARLQLEQPARVFLPMKKHDDDTNVPTLSSNPLQTPIKGKKEGAKI